MAKSRYWAPLTAIIVLEIVIMMTPAAAVTLPSDVEALQDLYKSLDNSPNLVGWKLEGGDPCEESWTGVSCIGASIVNITLSGLDLRGYLGRQLNLPNLKELVLSFNHIQGEIPDLLPPNLTYIDLSSNNFCTSIPHSLAVMKHLHYLNLSHNLLSGKISNLFTDLQQLQQMDLSYNNFIGDLPSSFGNLTSLARLFLQNNKFTGSVNSLEKLPVLIELNLQNNNFSGIDPKQFQHMANLGILGDAFQDEAKKLPPDTPSSTIFNDENASIPPATQLSSIEGYLLLGVGDRTQKVLIAVEIACGVVVVVLLAVCAAISITADLNELRVNKPPDLESSSTPLSTSSDNGLVQVESPEGQSASAQIESTTSTVMPIKEVSDTSRKVYTVSDTSRKVYTELRNTIPYYLACLTIWFPISIPCGLLWLFVVFMTICGAFFLWLGGEAFLHIQKIKKKENGGNNERVARLELGCLEGRENGVPLLEKSLGCKFRVGSDCKVAAVTSFAIIYTFVLTVYTVNKPCYN